MGSARLPAMGGGSSPKLSRYILADL